MAALQYESAYGKPLLLLRLIHDTVPSPNSSTVLVAHHVPPLHLHSRILSSELPFPIYPSNPSLRTNRLEAHPGALRELDKLGARKREDKRVEGRGHVWREEL